MNKKDYVLGFVKQNFKMYSKMSLAFDSNLYYVKSVQIWNLLWSVFSCIRSKCGDFSVFSPNTGKYGPEKTPHLDTFHAVLFFILLEISMPILLYQYRNWKLEQNQIKSQLYIYSTLLSTKLINFIIK